MLICNLDQERAFCAVVGKGFVPCLLSFALMDLLVIPRVRRRLRR
ncbi:putative membrane protein [Synechococcus sp. BOUM118]|nr:putative membrane protein [Synechococcus sp. BOUM118]